METSNINRHEGALGVAVSILSVLGGVLTSLALLGFLILCEVHSSTVSLCITGCGLILFSVFLNRLLHRAFLDACFISLYILGWGLLYGGIFSSTHSDPLPLFIFLGALSLFFCWLGKGFVLPFLSALLLNINLLLAVAVLTDYNFLSLLVITFIILMGGIGYFALNNLEAKIVATSPGRHIFLPLQAGFFVSFVAGLILSAHFISDNRFLYFYFQTIGPLLWAGIIFQVTQIMKVMEVKTVWTRMLVYALCACLLIPTIYAPYLAGAVLLLLASRYHGHRTESVVSFMLLLYMISKYYYDLQFSLLFKSGILFFSGLLLLTAWFFLCRKKKRL